MLLTEILKNNDTYNFDLDSEQKLLTLTQITMNKGSSGTLSLILNRNGKAFNICHLDINKDSQVSLNLTLLVTNTDSLQCVGGKDSSSTSSLSIFGLYDDDSTTVSSISSVDKKRTISLEDKIEKKEKRQEKDRKGEPAHYI